jgi:hypothetical protein
MSTDCMHQKYENQRTQANVRRKRLSNSDISESLAVHYQAFWHARSGCYLTKGYEGE